MELPGNILSNKFRESPLHSNYVTQEVFHIHKRKTISSTHIFFQLEMNFLVDVWDVHQHYTCHAETAGRGGGRETMFRLMSGAAHVSLIQLLPFSFESLLNNAMMVLSEDIGQRCQWWTITMSATKYEQTFERMYVRRWIKIMLQIYKLFFRHRDKKRRKKKKELCAWTWNTGPLTVQLIKKSSDGSQPQTITFCLCMLVT